MIPRYFSFNAALITPENYRKLIYKNHATDYTYRGGGSEIQYSDIAPNVSNAPVAGDDGGTSGAAIVAG